MAWGDLASNQMVSYSDASSGGFTLKPGQTNSSSPQCMTKNDAFTKYNLVATSNTNALASNQLMQKSFWTAATLLPYSYTFYYASADGDPNWGGFNTSSEACAATSFSATVYSSSSSIVVGMELFYDQYGTVPLNCTSYDQSGYDYYKINSTLIQFVNEGFFGGNQVYSTSACITFSATMTVGFAGRNYGYRQGIYGSMSNTNISNPAGENAVLTDFWWAGNVLGLSIYNESNVVPPNGWTTIGIDGVTYNRTSFTYSYNSPTARWLYTLSLATNPFGTVSGVTKTITLT